MNNNLFQILLIITFFTILNIPNNNIYCQKIDIKKLENENISENNKPSQYNKIALILLEDSIELSYQYAKKAYELSEKLLSLNEVSVLYEFKQNIKIEKGRAALIIGDIFYKVGNYTESEKFYSIALSIYEELNDVDNIILLNNNLGLVNDLLGNYSRSETFYLKALELARKITNDNNNISIILNNLGNLYISSGNYDKAIVFLNRALSLQLQKNNHPDIAILYNNIGRIFEFKGNYDNALDYYQKALKLSDSINDVSIDKSIFYNNIGNIYKLKAEYDKAINYFIKALEIDIKSNNYEKIAKRLNNIAEVYRAWGTDDLALTYYEKSLSLFQKIGNINEILTVLNNIASLYQNKGEITKAIDYYNQIKHYKSSLNDEQKSINYKNLGNLYKKNEDYNTSLNYFEKSLDIDKKIGNFKGIAANYSNIGQIYYQNNEFDKAEKLFLEAIEIAKKHNLTEDLATYYNNIAFVYEAKNNYEKSINYLQNSINIFENIRKTAPISIRKEYLSKTISAYQKLAQIYFKNNKTIETFKTMELSKARSLSEQISNIDTIFEIIDFNDFHKITKLYENENYLSFLFINSSELIANFSNSDTILFYKINLDSIIQTVYQQFNEELNFLLTNEIVNENNIENIDSAKHFIEVEKLKKLKTFRTVIDFYRQLIFDPAGEKRLPILSNILFNFLIKPIVHLIDTNEILYISPDGILGFLPFETLTDDNLNFICEKYEIKYTPSLSVLIKLKSRIYNDDRKTLLAIGGAIYNEEKFFEEVSYYSLRGYNKNISKNKAKLFHNFYHDNNYLWNNLKYTLLEIREIAKIFKNETDTLTAYMATENMIKQLSRNGNLENYKIIHLSTHGMTIPETPELSAIVLSQLKNPIMTFGEDGYLRMNEIQKLKIRADVVCLSSCETALGKIYKGEGIVGLTQSFIIAGANAVASSLWQVADESTAMFMIEVYRKIKNENCSYSHAINETKKKFIKGDFGIEWISPYFWAPFIYFGK